MFRILPPNNSIFGYRFSVPVINRFKDPVHIFDMVFSIFVYKFFLALSIGWHTYPIMFVNCLILLYFIILYYFIFFYYIRQMYGVCINHLEMIAISNR